MIVRPLPSNFQIENFTFFQTSHNVLLKQKQWSLPTEPRSDDITSTVFKQVVLHPLPCPPPLPPTPLLQASAHHCTHQTNFAFNIAILPAPKNNNSSILPTGVVSACIFMKKPIRPLAKLQFFNLFYFKQQEPER